MLLPYESNGVASRIQLHQSGVFHGAVRVPDFVVVGSWWGGRDDFCLGSGEEVRVARLVKDFLGLRISEFDFSCRGLAIASPSNFCRVLLFCEVGALLLHAGVY